MGFRTLYIHRRTPVACMVLWTSYYISLGAWCFSTIFWLSLIVITCVGWRSLVHTWPYLLWWLGVMSCYFVAFSNHEFSLRSLFAKAFWMEMKWSSWKSFVEKLFLFSIFFFFFLYFFFLFLFSLLFISSPYRAYIRYFTHLAPCTTWGTWVARWGVLRLLITLSPLTGVILPPKTYPFLHLHGQSR